MAKELNLNKLMLVTLAILMLSIGWPNHGYIAALEEEAHIEWSRILEGNHPLYKSVSGYAATATSDGGYVAVGDKYCETPDENCSYVVKLNSSGEILWEREMLYYDYDYEENTAFTVIETSDGSILVGGEIRDGSYGRPRFVPYVFRLSADGELLWQKYYPRMPYYQQSASNIQETSNGDFVITGGGWNEYSPSPAYLLKIDANGDELWSKTYPIGYSGMFSNIILTSDDGVIVAGSRTLEEYDRVALPYLLKINRNGEVVWQKTAETDSVTSTIVSSDDGNYILTRYNPSTQAYYLQKINEAGDILWNKSLNSSAMDEIESIIRTQPVDEGYVLFVQNKPSSIENGKSRYQIILLDENAVPTKKYQFGDLDLGLGKNGVTTYDQGLLVTGTVRINTGQGYRNEMHLLKISIPNEGPSNPELARLEFQQPELKLSVGQSAATVVNAVYSDASVTDVTYSSIYDSLDPSIASVDAFGNITGNSPGTTWIKAAYEGLETRIAVNVTDAKAPGRFYLDSEEYSLSIGTELDVAAYYVNDSGLPSKVTQDAVFSMDDPSIATIDEYGNIRGIRPGITHITATYNGATYRASVWVVRPYVYHQ
ncbi:Ig-like domain-containing protein [Paenibacillus woosongensis]|uniref:Ig-like domain-containing protein n=1 Tax=Paenibacillus woosongensis TaxID=307580 RepID=A0AA95I342_9BACL|nr:Ig-like domain-containing protein [Paenibacillus woosongensis]WHX47032.1 Ig-like domain-containing protein [Paenibacillus woosongensis]